MCLRLYVCVRLCVLSNVVYLLRKEYKKMKCCNKNDGTTVWTNMGMKTSCTFENITCMLHTRTHTHFGFHSMNFSYTMQSRFVCMLPAFFPPLSSSFLLCLSSEPCSYAGFLPMPNLAIEMHQRNMQYAMSALAFFLECVAPHRTVHHSTAQGTAHTNKFASQHYRNM